MIKLLFTIKLCIIILLLGFAHVTNAQRTLSTPNPSKEAVALYRYILDMYGKKIFSGQMWSNYSGDELAYIQTHTGKQPAFRGMDYMTTSSNNAETQRAIDWWRSGGIPTIMWHWGAPSKGEGYQASMQAIDINRCFQAGTAEYTAFWNELRLKADLLQRLRDANVPVLWRPYHELNGNWFWWGKGGSAQFKRLWTTMYNYFVNDRGLNNLIWVLCYTGSPDGSWFPGNQYVDIAGADTYNNSTGPQLDMFNRTKNATGGNAMPISFHETGMPPNPDQCLSSGAMWSWWMIWHSSHLFNIDRAYLRTVFNHNLVITKDEIPNIMTVYGGGTPPPPPATIANGTYRITPRHSGKAVDVAGSSTADGGNVQQSTYSGANNQKWIIQSISTGVYSIRALHSGKSMDVAGSSATDGANIQQFAYSGANNQRWRIESVGSGYYRIVSVNSGKCVDVAGNSSADGANVLQWTCSGSNNQSFTMQFLSSSTSRTAEEELIEANKMVVYPNPSNGLYHINFPGSFKYSIKDKLGNTVEKGEGKDSAITGNNLPAGVYILQLESLKETKELKLIKE